MKIFLDKTLSSGDIVEIKGYNQHHLRVSGISAGDKILVGDKNFDEFDASIIKLSAGSYTAQILEQDTFVRKPVRNLTLYVSLPKKDKFEDIIFRCTQVGVSEFVPFISSRTIKRPKASNPSRLYERWGKKARHGAELSQRERIPAVGAIKTFDEVLRDFADRKFGSGIILWEQSKGESISESDFAPGMALYIGPEGGFTTQEVESAENAGIKVRTLGPLVMDVETACIAGASGILCR